jgi:hypothetical protein
MRILRLLAEAESDQSLRPVDLDELKSLDGLLFEKNGKAWTDQQLDVPDHWREWPARTRRARRKLSRASRPEKSTRRG